MKRKIIAVLQVIILLAGVYLLYVYFNPAKKVSGLKADMQIASSSFLKDFEADDTLAEWKYKNKVVELEGLPSKVENNENGVNVIFDQQGKFIAVCALDSSYKKMVSGIAADKKMKVKGFYSGYTIIDDMFMIPAEIKLTQCIILNE